MISNIREDTLWQQVWTELISATTASDHQFNTPTLADTTKKDQPRLRTVVLRQVNAQDYTLGFYTDRRSVKAEALGVHAWFSWLFWDSKTQLQFTAAGPSRWLNDSATSRIFDSLPKHSRKAYATVTRPATVSKGPTSGLPHDWAELSIKQTEYARETLEWLLPLLPRRKYYTSTDQATSE